MKVFITYLCLLGLAFVFQSCDSDSPDNTNNGVVITGYTVTRDSQFINVPGINTSRSVTTVTLDNNKLMSTSTEVFIDGVSSGVSSGKVYSYQNGLVSSVDEFQNQRRLEFWYDSDSRLKGAKMTYLQQDKYYRFVRVSEDVTYMETISGMYNDAGAQILERSVLIFDSNDNIIRAGRDMNLDGVIENVNNYMYSDGNLRNAGINGGQFSFQYSTVINNNSYIDDATFGRRNLRLIEGELYAYGLIATNGVSFSRPKNLLVSEMNDGTYELRSDNFVKKHISTESVSDRTTVTTTEYFFR